MRKLLLIISAFLMSGCPGPGDYYHPDYPAQVKIKDNRPCVTVQPEGDEKVRAVLIHEMPGMTRERLFAPPPYTLRSGECLDIATYPFRLNTVYIVAATLVSDEKYKRGRFPAGRGFITRFRLFEGLNGVQVEEVEPEPPDWNRPARSSDAFQLITPDG